MASQEERINRLNQKLKRIDVSDRGGRLTKLANIEHKIDSLEDKFEYLRNQHDTELKTIRQQATKVVLDVEEANEFWLQNFNVERLVDAVGNIVQRVELTGETNRQSDQRNIRAIDEKTRNMKSEIGKEKKLRAEAVDDLVQIIRETFPKLEELVSEESSRRGESDEMILKRLNQEVSDLELELSKEKSSKEDNEKAIFDIIKDTVEKVKRELETEHKDRENSEQGLMRLLEDSMNKLNGIVQA